ncbi:MAG: electron transport complex subunit RsxC [Deltaproteobacteria bacterium]|nr:electron transport complex subunit RsxC [Deltaproteobacteria bacterium]
MSLLLPGAGKATFRHGIHPPERKDATRAAPIERMRFADTYVLALSQHIGAPSKAVVEVGQRVERGQLVAEPAGFVSTALHAPVAGTVVALEPRPLPAGKSGPCIVLRRDPFDSQRVGSSVTGHYAAGDARDLVQRVQRAGIVGFGGAAFPSHVKLAVPDGKRVQDVFLNGCECEPYLTCDHRVMVERPQAVLRGAELVRHQVQGERVFIGVEANKPDAIGALRAHIPAGAPVEVVELTVKYPQGAEKMLIDAVVGRKVPAGKLPIDVHAAVQNVATAAAIADLVDRGMPLVERVVTVTGPGIRRPANVLVPIGTPLRDLVDHCGGLLPNARQVVLGGPMMGLAQKDLDVPVTKGLSGVLVSTEPATWLQEQPCIRCGRCLDACPMFLNPQRLALMVRHERTEDLEALHLRDCFECASCSYVCPSNLPLVQLMRVGKGLLRRHQEAA